MGCETEYDETGLGSCLTEDQLGEFVPIGTNMNHADLD